MSFTDYDMWEYINSVMQRMIKSDEEELCRIVHELNEAS